MLEAGHRVERDDLPLLLGQLLQTGRKDDPVLQIESVVGGQLAFQFLREGVCFFFAQLYHSSMKYVGGIRRELGFRTVFNILGPLTNPIHPKRQLLGVYDESLVEPLARVLYELGVSDGMVVFGREKLDEISMVGPTFVCEFHNTMRFRFVLLGCYR